MKSIKKFAAIVTVFVMLGSTSISAHANCFGGGDHYRDPGVRCYGACFHTTIGVDGTTHNCTMCKRTKTTYWGS